MDAQESAADYIEKVLMGEINDAESKAMLSSRMGTDNDANGELLLGARMDDPDTPKEHMKAMVCPSLEFQMGPGLPMLLRVVTPGKIPDGSKERLLHATARLGLPLYYHVLLDWPPWAASPPETMNILIQTDDGDLQECSTNKMLHYLSTRTAPGSAQIRHVSLSGRSAPNILLTRVDGEDLSDEQVKCMLLYLLFVFQFPAHSLHSRLNPEDFAEFWKCLQLQDSGFEEDFPVSLACKACGKEDGKMFKCGKCGVVKYCGADCQKSHWDAHKKVCVKG